MERRPPSGETRAAGPTDADGVVAQLLDPSSRITVLGVPAGESGLLAHADVLAAGREGWSAAGRVVAVVSPGPEAARRWAVLSGIPSMRPEERPDILIVDRSDRLPTSDLLRLLRRHHGHLVLIEGGTMPRLTNPASHGLVEAGRSLHRHLLPPAAPWTIGAARGPALSGPLYGRAAAGELLRRWSSGRSDSLMVGLGPEEVWALNRAALAEHRPRRGPQRFRAGDRVVVLRPSSGLPSPGSIGTVQEVSRTRADGRPRVSVAWWEGGGADLSDARTLNRVGFGYAVTPRLAARSDLPLAVLGPAVALGRMRHRVIAELTTPKRGIEAEIRLRRSSPGRGLDG